jgi:adenylate cyclase
MFVALDAAAVAHAALELVDELGHHDVFDAARAGVATGDVLELEGDCYGPVVNRAARFVAAAPDGSVTGDAATVEALADRIVAEPLPAVEHRGLGEVPWYRLSAPSAAPR